MQKTIVISYSHEDESWKDRLATHLACLEKYCRLRSWDDRHIQIGKDWDPEIQNAFNQSSAAIFLITPSFLESEYIRKNELPLLLKRRKNEGLHVFPLYTRPCGFKHVPWLRELQLYPRDDRALSEHQEAEVDRCLATLIEHIADVLDLPTTELDSLVPTSPPTWPDFRWLAGCLLNEVPPEDRQWPAIRWKTLYTINLKRRLGSDEDGLPNSVISAIRQAGGLVCEALEQRQEDCRQWFGSRIAPNRDVFDRYPWYEDFLDPAVGAGSSLLSNIFKSARRLRRNRPGTPELGPDELAHVFFWESMAFAIFELRRRQGLRNARYLLEHVLRAELEKLSEMIRNLAMINAIRDVDAFWARKLSKRRVSLDSSDIVPYLMSSPEELEYLTRWQVLLSVVMINDDAKLASKDYGGPFPVDEKLNQSYRVFAQKASKKGVPVLISHYGDLPRGSLVGKQFAAWDLVGNQWKRRKRWTTEFFFDKFPSSSETRRLRQSILREPRIRIWNKVTLTRFIADKWRVHKLLDGKGVGMLAPCFPLDLKPTKSAIGPRRQEIVDAIRSESARRGYEFADDKPCIVIKPRTAWQGRGALRLTPEQFLSKDLSDNGIYTTYNGAVAQPFYESRASCPLNGVSGRHDIRVVIVGPDAVFGMIRDLGESAPDNEWVASLENVRRLGGMRKYVSKQELLGRRELSDVIGAVSAAINNEFRAMPSILSIDVIYVTPEDVRVVELNSKPSQVWEPGDEEGAKYVQLFQDAILEEFAKLYEEYPR